jgi:hypothetical protein
LPEQRNVYRSIKAHSAPQVEGQEPGRLDLGLFSLSNETSVICGYYEQDGFIGTYYNANLVIHRKIILKGDGLVILDFYKKPAIVLSNFNTKKIISNAIKPSIGYGKLLNQRILES